MIFSLVLLSQVLLLSWYLPRRIQQRMRYVLDNYPAHTYPKLYKRDQQCAEKSYNRIVRYNQLMLVVGILLLFWVVNEGEVVSGGIAMAIAFVYGMVQSVPIIVLDLASLNHYKQLREEDDRPKRTAALKPRSLFDHTSVTSVVIVAAFYLGAVVFDFYSKGFDWSLGLEMYEAALILGGTNLFFAWLVRWRVYGKKLNPYMDDKDYKREIDTIVISAIFTSIMVSVFFIAMRAINVYNLEEFEGVIMSIYMQAIMGFSMFYSMNAFDVREMNFDAFKAESH
jgi:uncharacterized membrane protein YbaN (DUF454 family)